MKKLAAALIAAVICLAASGCSGLSLNGSDLMTPPNAEGNQAQIQKLIRQSAGKKYEMVYPRAGEFQSSVIFHDLDGDSSGEAAAMYTTDKETTKILIADSIGDNYTLLAECSIDTARPDSIEFADFDGDGADDILVSYPGSTAALRSLTVITVANDIAQNDMIDCCAAHQIGDYNSDGICDLLTLALADGKTVPTAKLMIGTADGLSEQSECEVASDAAEYISLSFGMINDEISGAVVDSIDLNGEYSTQLICYDYNARGIVNPLYLSNNYSNTKRAAAITSADVDRDGIIEIPLCSMMEYAQSEDSASVCERIDWSRYDYQSIELVTVQSAVLCDRLGFILNLDAEHADFVTGRYIGENAMALYLWEYKRNTPTRTAKLLTVKRYPKSDYDKDRVLEAVAGENRSCVYTYIIEADNDYYGYTDSEVTDNFVIIEDPSENRSSEK